MPAAKKTPAKTLAKMPTQTPARQSTRAAKSAPKAKVSAALDGEADLHRFNFQTDSLGYALRRAQVHAYGLFFESLGELELSPARLTALSLIAMETDINQATLARRLNVAGPSVMKLIDALEGAGFIRRMDVVGDRRRYSLALTASGKAMLETLKTRLDAYEARLAQALKPAERQQLIALLDRLVG